MEDTWRNKFALAAVAWCALFGASACGKGPPPQLPTTSVRDRAAHHVGVVPLVVDEAARAERVRALYVRMDELMIQAKIAQAEMLVALGDENATLTDDEKRARFAQFQAVERRALETYIGLQMELRHITSPDEFARLGAIK